MSELVSVFGYGPVGAATVERLLARGQSVRVVQRSRPKTLPASAEYMACDVLNPDDVLRAMTGASHAVITIGFEYSGKIWKQAWPRAMENFIAAAEASGVRVIFIDNLYMYGPQRRALREEMPLTSFGVKPKVRSLITRMWMQASAAGRIKWTAIRAPDFYGPGVGRSHIGDVGLGMIAKGKAATLAMSPDRPHAFAYVPDIARATISLLDAGDDAYGQSWHVPCAPTRTPREILKLGADVLGERLRIVSIPSGLLPLIGLLSPFMREVAEMRFTLDRAYEVDSSKFAARFWSDATPFEMGVRATALAFRAAVQARGQVAGQEISAAASI